MSKICSELYRDFFYKINGMTFSMDEFVSFVSSAITEVAQELKIGRSSETFMAPKTPFNIDGINQTVILYTSEAGYDDCPETFIFRTGENGTLSMSFYPEKGQTGMIGVMEQLIRHMPNSKLLLVGNCCETFLRIGTAKVHFFSYPAKFFQVFSAYSFQFPDYYG